MTLSRTNIQIPEIINFNYIKFNVLTDNISDKFNNIFALSFFYIFSQSEIEKMFYKIHNILKKDGTFILDFGGCEDNLFSFFFNHIFLNYFVRNFRIFLNLLES